MEDVICELRDVGEKCSIHLPPDDNDDDVWIIGLTVSSELSSSLAESFFDSDLIIALFYIQRRTDGHWVTPHNDMPLVLNDEALDSPMLLSHGSVILVGDHTFTYLTNEGPPCAPPNDQPPSPHTHPPPKPKRHQKGSKLTQDVLSRSQQMVFGKGDTLTWITSEISIEPKENPKLRIVFDKDKPDTDIDKSTELFLSIRDSVINNDVELLEHIHTPEQMVNVCVSYLLQFCLNNGLTLSAKNMDTIYQTMTAMCTHQPACLFDFISGMKSKTIVTDQDMSPFLKLLNHTLLMFMDNMDTSEVCLKIFSHLSTDPQNIQYLLKGNSQSLLYACMSVYNKHAPIQIMACTFMENLSHSWIPQTDGRCPVREAALDLVVRAMGTHDGEGLLLRPALRTILNVLHAHAQRTKSLTELSGRTFSGESEFQEDLTSSVATLDFIESECLPVARGIYHTHEDDKEIRDLCIEIMEFFVEQDAQDQYDFLHHSLASQKTNNASIYDEMEQCHSHRSDKSTDSTTTSETENGDKPIVAECDSNAVYARVNKPKTNATWRENSIQEAELIENDIYDNNPPDHLSGSESEDEPGPELDYERRNEVIGGDSADLVSIRLDDVSDETDREALKEMTEENNSPDCENHDHRHKKNSFEITKKLGKYLRKLKPRKKQKFTPPHDLDGPSEGKTYVAFETCDSDFEVLDSIENPREQTEVCNCMTGKSSPSLNGSSKDNYSLEDFRYETAYPGAELPATDTYDNGVNIYEDITEYEKEARGQNEQENEEASIYELAGPCPWNKRKMETENKTETTTGVESPPRWHDRSPPALPPRDSDFEDSADEFIPTTHKSSKPNDTGSLDRSSNESLNSFIPNASEWEKISQTSEDEFINDASKGLSRPATPDPEPKPEIATPQSESETASMLSRNSTDSKLSEQYSNDPNDDGNSLQDDDVIDDVWSPQENALDYSTLKRRQEKQKGKKMGWVASLRQIYEKPQKKLSKVKSGMWRSRSCTNLAEDKQIIENPLYAGNLQKATSTMNLNEHKKAKRFRWGRKKSKDIPVLSTAPSSESLASLGCANAIPEESGEFMTSFKSGRRTAVSGALSTKTYR